MAITVDNTVAVVKSDGGSSVPTASFSATSGQLLLAMGMLDHNSQPYVAATISNSGTALTWTQIVNAGAADTGAICAWYTHLAADFTTRTVTLTRGSADSDTPALKVYILTDHDSADILGASTSTTSTTENLTSASITPETSGVGFGHGVDWTQSGNPTSSDLTNTSVINSAGNISGIWGYKNLTAAVGATANFNAAGTPSPGNWRYAWFEIRAAATAGPAAGLRTFALTGCGL